MPSVLGGPLPYDEYVIMGEEPYWWVSGGERADTPLKLEAFRLLLADYNPKIRDFICGVVEFGFAVVTPTMALEMEGFEVENYSSIHLAETQVNAGLQEELELNRIFFWPGKPKCVNARGAIPKRDYSEPSGRSKTKFRIITNMSKPIGKAVNEFSKAPKFKYAKFDEAVRRSFRGCWYCKVDLKAAYRHIALHRAMWELFGFKWDGRYCVDTRLPFGINSACWLFTLFTRIICWLCRKRGIKVIIGYMDDFLIIAGSKEEAQRAMDILLQVLAELGFEVALDKCEGPCQQVIFLGLVLNSLECTVQVQKCGK